MPLTRVTTLIPHLKLKLSTLDCLRSKGLDSWILRTYFQFLYRPYGELNWVAQILRHNKDRKLYSLHFRTCNKAQNQEQSSVIVILLQSV